MNLNDINIIKVASAGNFIKFIAELEKYGITHFITDAKSATSQYFNSAGLSIKDIGNFDFMIAELNAEQFINDLKEHQSGKTDFPTWLFKTTQSGIASWQVDILNRTCRYFDTQDNEVYMENVL